MLCCCAATAAACRCRGCKRSMRRRGNLHSLFSKVLNVMLNLFEMLLHIGHIFSNPWDSLVYKGASFKEQDFEKFTDFGFRTLKNFRIFRISGRNFFKVPRICHPWGSRVYKGAPRGGTLKKFRFSAGDFEKNSDFGAKFFKVPRKKVFSWPRSTVND